VFENKFLTYTAKSLEGIPVYWKMGIDVRKHIHLGETS
jgi:hypothetical protein